jgi:uncharacterized protein YqjF (DUF2071 family)
MRQSWHDVLFAHWPVDAIRLRDVVPAALPLDLFDGQAWLGVVPFHMTNVAPRAWPALPWVSAFAELNVRTYVRVADKPGVYFFSLDASNPLAVGAARLLFHLPYYTASMRVRHHGEDVLYESRRHTDQHRPAMFQARYHPVGPVRTPRIGSLEYFLTERYCLYTVQRALPRRLEIHHPPWSLQDADARIDANTMAAAAAIVLPDCRPLLHFSRRQDMVAWPMTRAER